MMSYDICSTSVSPKINIKGGGTPVHQWYTTLDQQCLISVINSVFQHKL